MYKLKNILFFFFFLSVLTGYSQKKASLINYEEFKIESKVLNEDRFYSVYLPNNYENNDQNYPVLYLLDGRAHFQHAVSASQFLSVRRTIPEIIVVAVYNIDRNKDFSPVYDKTVPTSGGAEKFLEFLAKELRPVISDKYRTSAYDIVLGHSFGGTFITYSLLTKPELFDAYISVSPFLQYADNYMVKQTKEKLRDSYKSEIKYFMTVGNEPPYFKPLGDFSAFISEKAPENLILNYEKMPTENHGTIPYITMFKGLKYIFSDFQLTQEKLNGGLAALDEHYKNISKKYGVQASAPENAINLLGYNYLRSNDTEKAIKIFIENVKRYPYSANVYDSLGEAYETVKNYKSAEKNYKKAYDIGSAKLNPNTEIYKKNYERVKGK